MSDHDPAPADPTAAPDATATPDPTAASGAASDDDPGQTFGADYYRHDCGIPYERNDHWLRFFGDVADRIVRDLRPASVLDAGCAMGFLVEGLRERGVQAYGVDVSDYAISRVHPSVAEFCWVASLTEPLPRRYDLVTCVEVIEHIDASEAEKVVANLCAATDRLLISSSPFDYAEPTHVNVQPPEDWSALLAHEGFLRDLDYDASYLTPWAALYRRIDEPLSDTVRRYDRAWWRQRWEIHEMRGSLVQTRQRLEQLAGGEHGGVGRAAVDARVAELEEEVLRLRDRVIGAEAELGTALGEVAELREWNMRYTGLAERLDAMQRSRSWRAMWVLGAPVRLLRSRRSG